MVNTASACHANELNGHATVLFTDRTKQGAFVGGQHADLGVMAVVEASTGPENLGWGSEGSCAAMRPH